MLRGSSAMVGGSLGVRPKYVSGCAYDCMILPKTVVALWLLTYVVPFEKLMSVFIELRSTYVSSSST